MFSLIITIVSVALVAVLALATLYYGGDAFTDGASAAGAARVANQAEQLLAASDVFYAQVGRQPNSIDELVSSGYLKTAPVSSVAVSEALAANPWRMAVTGNRDDAGGGDRSGIPVFVLDVPDLALCQAVNEASYGQPGVLPSVRTYLLRQCYGTSVSSLKTMVSRNPARIEEARVAELSLGGTAAWAAGVTFAQASDAPIPDPASTTEWLVRPGERVATSGTPVDNSGGNGTGPSLPVLSLDGGASASFGTVASGAVSSVTVVLNNPTQTPAASVFAQLSGPAALALGTNTCGTAQAPVSLAAGASCSTTVTLSSLSELTLSGAALSFGGSFQNSGLAVSLSGTVQPPPTQARWGALPSGTALPENFGSEVQGTTTLRHVHLNNSNLAGALTASFTLSGDTSQFQLVSVEKVAVSGVTAGCGATVLPASSTACAGDSTASGTRYHLRVGIRYNRVTAGTHSITLTPAATGTVQLPAPLTLTGTTATAPVPYPGTWVDTGTTTVSISGVRSRRATDPLPATGKWYWETTVTGTHGMVGVGAAAGVLTNYPGGPGYSFSCGYFLTDGGLYVQDSSVVTSGSAPSASSTMGIAYDADTRTARFFRGGLAAGACRVNGTVLLYPVVGGGASSGNYTFVLNVNPTTIPAAVSDFARLGTAVR